MHEPLEIELSKNLFSADFVEVVREALQDRLTVEIAESDTEKFTIRVLPVDDVGQPGDRQRFYEVLSGALMDHLTARAAVGPALPTKRRPSRMIDVTLHLIADANSKTIVISADPTIHFPTILLCAVAPLRDRARITLETTNPVDRAVVVVSLSKDELVSCVVAQILRRLVDEPEQEGDPLLTGRP